MRRLSVSILAGLVALSLVFVGACGEPSSTPTPTPTPTETPSATPAEPVVIKFADLSAPGSSRTKVMQWFCDEVESRTDGRVTFEIYWSSGLVKGKEMLDGVSSGLTDFGHLVAFYFPDDLPVSNVAAMPFLTGDVYAMLHANKDLFDHPALVEEQERHNMKYLLAAGAPSYNLFMTDGFVKNLEDLQGKRIRSFGAFAKALTMLGATTLSIDTGETYDALVRGVADGAMNSVYGGLAH